MKLPEDQFSVKFYVARFLLIIPYFKKNYIALLTGAIIGGIVGGIVEYFKFKETKYSAEIYFTIDAPGGNDGGGLSSLLGLANNGESSNIFSNGNFEELVKLPVVYKKALLLPINNFGKKELFINYLIKNHTSIWYFENIKGKYFPQKANIDSLTDEQKSTLSFAASYFMEITSFKKESDLSSFRKVKVITPNDTLSYLWANNVLNSLTDIYIKNKTKKSAELVSILGKRVDSLRNALYYTQGKLAKFADQNQQIVFQSAKITADRLQLNSSQLQGLYNEAIRNYDNYKFSLAKETPLVNIISKSDLPTYTNPYRWGFLTVFGTLVGALSVIVLLYFVRVYKEFLND
ncbi:hypothetical protein EOJ36_01480 [Sandaracinomonas limnophila]|uniref:Lipopolysaccharide biosynthesis protein n=1 Tax=Sandaracinomonas limnophila TaxID=1862386 RepID=A0A437PWQ2_9BACT|nr:hypothetical protein [Sandaracinomonas limnophila]RVU26694.1 hypothetical protein EOJ36_01480 [Sandaracinomonas limnophila]